MDHPSPRPKEAFPVETFAIAIFLVCAFLLQVYLTGKQQDIASLQEWFKAALSTPAVLLTRMGGNKPSLTIQDHQYFRLIIACFLHGGLLHLFMNVYALTIIGPVVERCLGRGWLWGTFIFSGILGSVLSAVFSKGNIVSIGASGGLFGLIAMAAILTWLAPRRTGLRKDAAVQWLVYAFVMGYALHADNWGHFGGALGGGVCGLATMPFLRSVWAKPRWPGILAGTVGIVLSVAAIALASQAYQRPSVEADDEYNAQVERLAQALTTADPALSMQLALKLDKRHPKDPQAQYFVARAYAMNNDCESAVQRMEVLIELPEASMSETNRTFAKRARSSLRLSLISCYETLGRKNDANQHVLALCSEFGGYSAEEKKSLSKYVDELCKKVP